MNYAIVGASGLVGGYLSRRLTKHNTLLTSSSYSGNKYTFLDLLDPDDYQVIAAFRPNYVFITAAETNVDLCEIEKNRTKNLNVKSTINFIRYVHSALPKARIVFFSTSYVFSGELPMDKDFYPMYEPEDDTNPLNEYGKQKLAVEKEVLRLGHTVIRTVGVFGALEDRQKNFASRIVAACGQGSKVFVHDNEFMNPIHASDLAKISIIITKLDPGLYHVAGDTCVSKYQFALDICSAMNLDSSNIVAVSEPLAIRAKRPVNGCIVDSRFDPPSYMDGIKKFANGE